MERLAAHLRVLEPEHASVWYAQHVLPGAQWESELASQVQSAQLLLFLVSADFLNSRELSEHVVRPALERLQRGETQIIPIILRPVYWQETPFGKLQPLPEGGKPVTDSRWKTLDHAFLAVVCGIRRVLAENSGRFTGPEHSDLPAQRAATLTSVQADAGAHLERIIQDLTSLRGQIASAVRLNRPQGFTTESCESQYSRLYGEAMVFLARYLPQVVSGNEQGFVEAVYEKARAQLQQRSSMAVWLARRAIAPLAELEKLAAQIDACIATLEAYKQHAFLASPQQTPAQSAQPRPTPALPREEQPEAREKEQHVEPSPLCDICIVCALHAEAEAVIDEFSTRCHCTFLQGFYGLDHYEYRYTTIYNQHREALTVLVTWLPEMGPTAMAQEVKLLVQQFQPRFMAMTGICAADRRKVRLGDLIVASAAYHYEAGKRTADPQAHQPAIQTFGPSDQILQYVRGWTGWEKSLAQMKAAFLPQEAATEPTQCFVAALASGMAVRADDPFPWLQQYHRQTMALDMEAASFYAVLRSLTHALVVKGVCDYADLTKNDAYHTYAARASAVYLLSFIQEYVTAETMPRPTAARRTPAPQASHSLRPTDIRMVSTPSREGNRAALLFVLNGTEHTLEYVRHDMLHQQILLLKEHQQELVRLTLPFATLTPVEKQAAFQIQGVAGLLTCRMSAVTSIMHIQVTIAGVEVFHN